MSISFKISDKIKISYKTKKRKYAYKLKMINCIDFALFII